MSLDAWLADRERAVATEAQASVGRANGEGVPHG
jgi:hypothetical protein